VHFFDFAMLAAGIILAGLVLLSAGFRRRCLTAFSRTKFWFSYPFVMIAYLQRKRHHRKKIVPPLWLSSGELLSRDLELYVTGEGKNAIDGAFIEGLAKTRDETYSVIKKQLIVSFAIFLFLFANYLAIGVDVNIGGFTLKYAKGVPEGLMLISNLPQRLHVVATIQRVPNGVSNQISGSLDNAGRNATALHDQIFSS